MQNKVVLGLAIVALILGGLACWKAFSKLTTPQPSVEKLSALEKEVESIKAGLPPVWGGWPAMGFMIKVKGGPTVYFAGDTDTMLNWDAIREYWSPDIVIATHSVLFQMGKKEWVYVINKIKPKYVIASHHGSFPFYPQSDDDFVEAINTQTGATAIKLPGPGKEFEVMGLKFTWLGHSGFIIETPQGSRIAFDPEWSGVNTKNFPEEFKNPEKFAADLILISHGHFDHFDPQALKILLTPTKGRNPHLVTIFELSAYAKKLLPEHAERILPINLGTWVKKEHLEKAFGAKLTHLDDIEFAGIAATHSSGVFSPIK
jgi:L-ascorbate metabolism protein UlaG (beta-lactamase superfamily)